MKIFTLLNNTNFSEFLLTYYSFKKLNLNKNLLVYCEDSNLVDKIRDEKISVSNINIYKNKDDVVGFLLKDTEAKENENLFFIESGVLLKKNPFSIGNTSLFFADLVFLKEYNNYSVFCIKNSQEIRQTLEKKGKLDLDYLQKLLEKKEGNILVLPSSNDYYEERSFSLLD